MCVFKGRFCPRFLHLRAIMSRYHYSGKHHNGADIYDGFYTNRTLVRKIKTLKKTVGASSLRMLRNLSISTVNKDIKSSME